MTTLNSVIGDAVAPTGFARVIHSLFQPLHRDFEMHQMATRYDDGPHDHSWPLDPANQAGNVYGHNQQAKLVNGIRPAGIEVFDSTATLTFCYY